jgi:hypothetical protein
MNIFVLDETPYLAAEYQCDKHVVKMCLESTQILCNAFPLSVFTPYKRTHVNHPASIWARQSTQNYEWLINHCAALLQQYHMRYNRIHACQKVLNWIEANIDLVSLPPGPRTPFVQCMPDQYRVVDDPVQGYRNYYINEKASFAKWSRGIAAPYWWTNGLGE